MITEPKRATGRTTGLILQALGKAVENPGTEVEFIDHHEQNHTQLQLCKERIESIAKQLNLDVSVDLRLIKIVNLGGKEHFNGYYTLYVKSNWGSPYSQRTPAEEAYKKVFGYYPVTDIGDAYWEYFQKGFEASQK